VALAAVGLVMMARVMTSSMAIGAVGLVMMARVMTSSMAIGAVGLVMMALGAVVLVMIALGAIGLVMMALGAVGLVMTSSMALAAVGPVMTSSMALAAVGPVMTSSMALATVFLATQVALVMDLKVSRRLCLVLLQLMMFVLQSKIFLSLLKCRRWRRVLRDEAGLSFNFGRWFASCFSCLSSGLTLRKLFLVFLQLLDEGREDLLLL